MSSRGRGYAIIPRRGYSSRGRGYYTNRGSHFDSMPRRSRDGDSYQPKSEMELTKALVSSVLESGESRRQGSSYKHHSSSYPSDEFGHERKKYQFKESERPIREHRPHSESRRYPKEHRHQEFSRSTNVSKDNYKYVERKQGFDEEFSGHSSIKRQRIGSEVAFRESKYLWDKESRLPIHHQELNLPLRRDSRRNSRPEYKPHLRYEPNFSHFSRGRGGPSHDYHRLNIKTSGRLNFNGERLLPYKTKGSSHIDDEMPMKVTIKTGGMREVDGKYNLHGSDHVQLKCPHCPNYEAITFRGYRFHLDNPTHNRNLEKLIHKHSTVLRKIRLQQRDDQRELEQSMKKEEPEKCQSAESVFCDICKLEYKVFSNDSQKAHDKSRFHKMQVHYLRPNCKLCEMKFPSLMVYEYHMASIRHLTSLFHKKMAKVEQSTEDEQGHGDDKEDFDMSNFVTMDAVGEDETASVSDNEDITGKFEDVEAAIEETKADYENSNRDSDESACNEEDENNMKSKPVNTVHEEKSDDEDELLVEDYHSDDENDLIEESVGTEYLCEIEVMLCRLCGVAIRMDFLGTTALDKHCRSADHVSRYNDMLERKTVECRDSVESNNAISENPEEKDENLSPSDIVRSPSQSASEHEEDKDLNSD